jgi:hypothetical protein
MEALEVLSSGSPFPLTTYPSGHPAVECPHCGSGNMCWITNRMLESRYLCEACGRCWKVDARGASQVDPVRCAGCGHREQCFGRLRREFPPWWWVPVDEVAAAC